MAEPTVQTTAEEPLPLNFARVLSWVSFVLVFCTCLGLSVFIADTAREALIVRQQEFARLLVGNLNHQIFQRFTLPTVLSYGRIALRQPVQYERLEQVIQSVTQGLQVERLRIYDFNRVVAYSTDRSELGRTGMAPNKLDETLYGGTPQFELLSTIPTWRTMFSLPYEPGSYTLRVLYPLHGERSVPQAETAPAMGVLELTQDITEDYESVVTFQWLIVGMCLFSSTLLFIMLLLLIRRVDRVFARRMAETRRLELELHANERLTSMGRVVASIAHEIRNPLGIIRSSAELLLRRVDSADKSTGRILTAIFDESVRLSQTVNDFLDYARPRVPRRDMTDINLVLDRVTAFLEGEHERNGVEVHRDLPENFFVLGDKDLLYRAFYNILANARQAMEGPGNIFITGSFGEANGAKVLRVNFRDSGPGFPPDKMEQMLDPFVTTKDGGTGLGLPIVCSIISGHGGSIELSNAQEGGAVVTVCLPAAPQAETDEQSSASEES